jgi:hypothetical protein
MAPLARKMQNTFRELALFKPIFTFKATSHQLQPNTGSYSPLIQTAINFKAMAGLVNPNPMRTAIKFNHFNRNISIFLLF